MRAAVATGLIGILIGALWSGASARSGSAGFPRIAARIETSAEKPDSRLAWRLRVEAARQRYEAFAARAGSEVAGRPQLVRHQASFEPLPDVLEDPTLRYNDMVVTRDGVLVFRGAEGSRHSTADFERLPDARVRALSLRTFGQND